MVMENFWYLLNCAFFWMFWSFPVYIQSSGLGDVYRQVSIGAETGMRVFFLPHLWKEVIWTRKFEMQLPRWNNLFIFLLRVHLSYSGMSDLSSASVILSTWNKYLWKCGSWENSILLYCETGERTTVFPISFSLLLFPYFYLGSLLLPMRFHLSTERITEVDKLFPCQQLSILPRTRGAQYWAVLIRHLALHFLGKPLDVSLRSVLWCNMAGSAVAGQCDASLWASFTNLFPLGS